MGEEMERLRLQLREARETAKNNGRRADSEIQLLRQQLQLSQMELTNLFQIQTKDRQSYELTLRALQNGENGDQLRQQLQKQLQKALAQGRQLTQSFQQLKKQLCEQAEQSQKLRQRVALLQEQLREKQCYVSPDEGRQRWGELQLQVDALQWKLDQQREQAEGEREQERARFQADCAAKRGELRALEQRLKQSQKDLRETRCLLEEERSNSVCLLRREKGRAEAELKEQAEYYQQKLSQLMQSSREEIEMLREEQAGQAQNLVRQVEQQASLRVERMSSQILNSSIEVTKERSSLCQQISALKQQLMQKNARHQLELQSLREELSRSERQTQAVKEQVRKGEAELTLMRQQLESQNTELSRQLKASVQSLDRHKQEQSHFQNYRIKLRETHNSELRQLENRKQGQISRLSKLLEQTKAGVKGMEEEHELLKGEFEHEQALLKQQAQYYKAGKEQAENQLLALSQKYKWIFARLNGREEQLSRLRTRQLEEASSFIREQCERELLMTQERADFRVSQLEQEVDRLSKELSQARKARGKENSAMNDLRGKDSSYAWEAMRARLLQLQRDLRKSQRQRRRLEQGLQLGKEQNLNELVSNFSVVQRSRSFLNLSGGSLRD